MHGGHQPPFPKPAKDATLANTESTKAHPQVDAVTPSPRTHAAGELVDTPISSSDGAVVVMDNYLYWLGGTTGWPNKVARRFDVNRHVWERMPSGRVGRMTMQAAVLNDEIVVVGGTMGVGRATDEIELCMRLGDGNNGHGALLRVDNLFRRHLCAPLR